MGINGVPSYRALPPTPLQVARQGTDCRAVPGGAAAGRGDGAEGRPATSSMGVRGAVLRVQPGPTLHILRTGADYLWVQV